MSIFALNPQKMDARNHQLANKKKKTTRLNIAANSTVHYPVTNHTNSALVTKWLMVAMKLIYAYQKEKILMKMLIAMVTVQLRVILLWRRNAMAL